MVTQVVRSVDGQAVSTTHTLGGVLSKNRHQEIDGGDQSRCTVQRVTMPEILIWDQPPFPVQISTPRWIENVVWTVEVVSCSR